MMTRPCPACQASGVVLSHYEQDMLQLMTTAVSLLAKLATAPAVPALPPWALDLAAQLLATVPATASEAELELLQAASNMGSAAEVIRALRPEGR